MPPPRLQDFVVDVAAREVKHVSGATFSFLPYETYAEWLVSDGVTIWNEHLLPGNSADFAEVAKGAAIKAGMRHRSEV